jgi:hypothetical protein
MLFSVRLGGAYGRRYANAENVLQDWLAGLDFRDLEAGCYCSIRDFKRHGDTALDVPVFWPSAGDTCRAQHLPRGE